MHARAIGVAVAAALLTTIGVTLSVACPLCFSQADAQTADGLNDAVLLLMGLTGSVLGGIAAFVISLRRRAGKVVRAIGGGQSLHGGKEKNHSCRNSSGCHRKLQRMPMRSTAPWR